MKYECKYCFEFTIDVNARNEEQAQELADEEAGNHLFNLLEDIHHHRVSISKKETKQ